MFSEINRFSEFGDFRLDAKTRVLYHLDEAVALKPKAVETLIVLIENAGLVVSKEELLSKVWSDVFVEENNLSVNIYELRKAFAKFAPDSNFIQTVPRRGFQFVAEIKKKSDFSDAHKNNRELTAPDFISAPIESASSKAEEKNLAGESAARNGRKKAFVRQAVINYSFFSLPMSVLALAILAGGFVYLNQKKGAPNFADQTKRQTNQNLFAPNSSERPTANLEAFQLYERGRQLWQSREIKQMEEGVKYFRRAIQLDPNFAAPYIGLADSLSMMRDDADEWREAKVNVEKAIAIAPESAEARASSAFIKALNEWKWHEAEEEFKDAIRLDENCAKAHQWYATLLMIERRFDEAERELRRAVEIEPLSPTVNRDLCELYIYSKSFEETVKQCRLVSEIAPRDSFKINLQPFFLIKKMREPEFKLNEGDERQFFSEEDFLVYQQTGAAEMFRRHLSHTQKNPRPQPTLQWFALALNYAALGEREKALENLEKAYAAHGFMMAFINANPQFDDLRDEPRFQALIKRIGLND